MARLNDLPPAAESLESLKRRFIRQNREIARANSIQSSRIRTLESEVSRLVTENTALRKEISCLNRDLEKRQGSERFDLQVFDVKEKLEAKLAELSVLVADLGALPQKRLQTNTGSQAQRAFSQLSSPVIARCGQNASGLDEERLPVILEDRIYQRQSLDIEEVPESPIRGQGEGETFDGSHSPPILSFVANSISQFSSHLSPSIPETSNCNVSTSIDKSPSPGIRLKRRDSSFLEDIITDNEDIALQADTSKKPQVSRVGSKRKFAVREEDDSDPGYSNDKDDFQYARLNMPSKAVTSTTYDSENRLTMGFQKLAEQPVREKKSNRRALGPKSNNTSLKSPIKLSSEKLKAAVEEKKSTRSKGRPRKDRPHADKTSDQQASGAIESQQLVQIPPTTPATQPYLQQAQENEALDNGLPVASPTTAGQDSLSRRSVVSIDSTSTDVEASMTCRTRQSRRSRGPVSYAEPNLRDKMRRPTEELVDAVGGNRSKALPKIRAEHIEEFSKDQIRQPPQHVHYGSPNTPQTSNGQTTESTHSAWRITEATCPQQSPSSIAISTLVSGSKKRCQSNQQNASRRHSSNPLLVPSIPQNLPPEHEAEWDLADNPPGSDHAPSFRSSAEVTTSETQRVHATRRRSMMV